jgi:hypothetical protein
LDGREVTRWVDINYTQTAAASVTTSVEEVQNR